MWASTMARSAIVDMPGVSRRAALPAAMEDRAPSAVIAAAAAGGQDAAETRCSTVPPVSRGPMAFETAARAAAVQSPPRTWAQTSHTKAVRFTAHASRAVWVRGAGTRRAIWASESRSMALLCRPHRNVNSGGTAGRARRVRRRPRPASRAGAASRTCRFSFDSPTGRASSARIPARRSCPPLVGGGGPARGPGELEERVHSSPEDGATRSGRPAGGPGPGPRTPPVGPRPRPRAPGTGRTAGTGRWHGPAYGNRLRGTRVDAAPGRRGPRRTPRGPRVDPVRGPTAPLRA